MLFLAIGTNAQDAREKETVSLPDYVMSQVVQRIVIEHFKGRRSGEFLFSEKYIDREWMPKMDKIKFVFVDEADDKEVHFFKEPTRDGEVYEIDFGWGDPTCSAMGDTWQFRISNSKVRDLTKTSTGWGMGCGRSRGYSG